MRCEARTRGNSQGLCAENTFFSLSGRAFGTEQEKPETYVNTAMEKTRFVSVFRSHNCRPYELMRVSNFDSAKIKGSPFELREASAERRSAN